METLPCPPPDTIQEGQSYCLVYYDGSVKTHILREGRNTLGRREANDIVINDHGASRDHAIVYGGSPPMLQDLGSRNGTKVGGRLIRGGDLVALEPGTVVEIGAVSLFVQLTKPGTDSQPISAATPPVSEARPSAEEPETSIRSAPFPLSPSEYVVRDERMRRLYSLAETVAQSDLSVLIEGETGVGKEKLAERIHFASVRATRPFIAVNCAAIPEHLMESELFGYERGAFTGAVRAKAGLITSAQSGTLFLDEVGELSAPTQAKFLRVLETREVMRLGALKPVHVDVRFIAATNRDLRRSVSKGLFREDLFHRLNGVTLTIPPLRDRPEDVVALAELFIARFAERVKRTPPRLSPEVTTILGRYRWPGNVRELKSFVERAVLMTAGDLIEKATLDIPEVRNGAVERGSSATMRAAPQSDSIPPETQRYNSSISFADRSSIAPSESRSYSSRDSRAPRSRESRSPRDSKAPRESKPAPNSKKTSPERDRIMQALATVGGNQAEAAKLLGVSRRTLINWLDTYTIPRPRKKSMAPSDD